MTCEIRQDIIYFQDTHFSKIKGGCTLESSIQDVGIVCSGCSDLAFIKKFYRSATLLSLEMVLIRCSRYNIQAHKMIISSFLFQLVEIFYETVFYMPRGDSSLTDLVFLNSLWWLLVFHEGAYLADLTLYLFPSKRKYFISHVCKASPYLLCFSWRILYLPYVPRGGPLCNPRRPVIWCCLRDAVPRSALLFARLTFFLWPNFLGSSWW